MSEVLIEATKERLRQEINSWPDVELVQTYPEALELLFRDGSRLYVDVQEVDDA